MGQQISSKKYIQTRARTLAIDRCLVNPDWETSKNAHVIVIRKHANDNVTYAGYLVDLLCLGIKDTYYDFNLSRDHLEGWLNACREDTELIEIEYPVAHNIVFAGHDLAVEYNIPQHPDFATTTRYLLEEDDESIPLVEIATGDEDGWPHLMVYPDDLQPLALARLKEYPGEGKFRYTILEEEEEEEDE